MPDKESVRLKQISHSQIPMPERKRNRLYAFNYSEIGSYFITACVDKAECVFGEIAGGELKLNDRGMIAYNQFGELQKYYETIEIDCFVIMPNHIHALIRINDMRFDGTRSIPAIVQAYKSFVTRKTRQAGLGFKWQRSYWDSIVKGSYGLDFVREYIKNNPAKWMEDAENHKSGLDKNGYYKKLTDEVKKEKTDR